MKIKLNRDLWNHKAGEEITVGENHGTWAVVKGYADEVSESQPENKASNDAENKAITPKYKRNKIK